MRIKKLLLVTTCITMMGIVVCGCNSSEKTNSSETQSTVQESTQEEEEELTMEEKYAVILLHGIRDRLKNPHSFKIYTLKCSKADERGCNFYIESSATNDFGGEVESAEGYWVDSIYFTGTEKDIAVTEISDTGIMSETATTDFINECDITIDVDKVMKHIDDKVY